MRVKGCEICEAAVAAAIKDCLGAGPCTLAAVTERLAGRLPEIPRAALYRAATAACRRPAGRA